LRGISNIVIAILMLAILVPVSIVIIDRARYAAQNVPQPQAEPMVFAYGFYNNTPSYNYTIVVINLGPGQATVTGIVDSQSNVISASCTIDQGKTCTINIRLPSTKPTLVIIKEKTSPVTIRTVNY
jgi:hypothetical protein